jgi:SnoaL-like protein
MMRSGSDSGRLPRHGLRRGDVIAAIAIVFAAASAAGVACAGAGPASTQPSASEGAGAAGVEDVLDAFHAAAAAADEGAYFGLFAPEGVFLGTAGEERWTVEEFRAFVHPYFSKGKGWTYTPRPGRRHIGLSPDAGVAWFDEVLDNAKYGECRGTGALRRIEGKWRIVQYNLTIPIPNEIAPRVVEMIRAAAGDP